MDHSTGRRVAAARLLAGYTNQDDFADALALPKFGGRTLREVERDKRPLYDHERDAIARMAGISVAFFTADLSKIAESPATSDSVDQTPEMLTPELAREALERLLAVAGQEPNRGAGEAGR